MRKHHHHRIGALLLLGLGCWLPLLPAVAQPAGAPLAFYEGTGIEEQRGAFVPEGLSFFNEEGQAVRLGTFFTDETPVLLNLVYHDCPNLCNLVLEGLTGTLREMDWVPGAQFDVLTVSINAYETPELARQQKARYVEALGKPEAARGWHFLTGTEDAIEALTESVGFQYRWDEETEQFVHPAALIVLSGEGKVTRYLAGLRHAPRDVRLTLVEASEGQVGSAVDQLFLSCFQFDREANTYVLHAANAMKVGGLLTVVAFGFVLFLFWRRERQKLDELTAAS